MRYRRLAIETESPEERGYDTIRNNLTESSVRDLALGDLGGDLVERLAGLVLCYGDHRGEPGLRELLAVDLGVDPTMVCTTPGAAGALFMVATATLEPGDHAVVARTNYSTNLETPRLIGARLSELPLRFEDGFALDQDHLAELVEPGSTRLISLTYPHNPTGAMIDRAQLEGVIHLAESSGAWLLIDETYRELTVGAPLPPVCSLTPRGISVSSLSKAYGIPGIRLGWMACGDPGLADTLLAAKEQVCITSSRVDETVALVALEQRDRLRDRIAPVVAAHRELVTGWMADQDLLEWVPPSGGVVAFPRLVESVDPDAFYRHCNDAGTFLGEGHWFDEDRRFFRLGFGWPTTEELRCGLADITAAAEAARI